jgi:endonuclease/exonuclease/phosphatase family metal-dependent hydrolase
VETLTVLSWNLFHGRDAPPGRRLHTWRSRLTRKTEDDGFYLQVNRPLKEEFATVIGRAEWAVCLLQEAPPAWAPALAGRSGAHFSRCLTSRNELAPLTRALASWNPDLIASWEGGSNLALVRAPWRILTDSRRSLLLSPLLERGLRERRRMCFARLRAPSGAELCVANIHADSGARNERELRRAAAQAVAWADGAPLVMGGDFNRRPRASPLFEALEREFGLAPATAPDAIDHLLARGLEVVRSPARWPETRRELEVAHLGGTRRIRLSDHAPVEATFALRECSPP